MGLPSGVQWAYCNVGAESQIDEGLFFSWGNVEGHAIGEGYNFSQTVYNSTPGANISTDLSLEQDAARVNLGEPWRMPTSNELQELYDNCTHVWTSINGVSGVLFTSVINGNTLFFPATGRYAGRSLVNHGSYGYYLPSTFYSETAVRCLTFDSSTVNPQNLITRYFGFPVRAVIQL